MTPCQVHFLLPPSISTNSWAFFLSQQRHHFLQAAFHDTSCSQVPETLLPRLVNPDHIPSFSVPREADLCEDRMGSVTHPECPKAWVASCWQRRWSSCGTHTPGCDKETHQVLSSWDSVAVGCTQWPFAENQMKGCARVPARLVPACHLPAV